MQGRLWVDMSDRLIYVGRMGQRAKQKKQGFLSPEYMEAASGWDLDTCRRMATHLARFASELQAMVNAIEREQEEERFRRN